MNGEDDRLESWKEIAAFLQRETRTVQRWERSDGLPVYRRPGGRAGGVFAYRSELEAWQRRRSTAGATDPAPAPWTRRRAWLSAVAAAAAIAAALLLVEPSAWPLRPVVVALGLVDRCSAPRGLLSAWHGEGDARDATARRAGVPEGGVRFDPGRTGLAFTLDGETTRIRIQSPRIGSIADSPLTVAAWVRFRSVTNPRAVRRAPYDDMSIVDRMAPAPDRFMSTGFNLNGWRLLKQSDHRFWFCLGGRDTNRCGQRTNTVFSSTVVVPDRWYHVAAVRGSESFDIYVDGVREDSRPLPAADIVLDTAGADLLFGFNATEGSFLHGALDEVMLFDRGLSGADVRVLVEAAGPGCAPAAIHG